MMQIVKRQKYVDRINSLLGKGLIIVLTGQRRVGKSCVLRQLMLEKEGDLSNNIIYIDKEKSEFDSIKTYLDLTEFIELKWKEEKHNYIFIDEIQEIDEFERTLRNYYTRDNADIIITGSNARMLSSELSTLLAGRYIDVHIGSLSYLEFLDFHQLADSDDSLRLYLTYGGLPQLYRLGLDNDDIIKDYLYNIYNTILLKDVVFREKIRNVPFLQNLIHFVSDNVGQMVSASSIMKFMKSQKVDVTTNLVLSYLSFFCNSFVVNKVQRYDVHGKRLFEIGEKYYFEDLGLRNVLVSGSHKLGDIEKLLENAVFLHLKNLGYEITIGQLQQKEIDFVARKRDKLIYVQVAYLLATEDTIKREFGNLEMIDDNYSKYVVSMDSMFSSNFNGIKHLSLRQFLCTEDL